MNILSKLKFIWKKPKVVIITGEGRTWAKEAIFQVLKEYFRIGNEILILETDLINYPPGENVKFLIRKSPLPILMVTHIADIPSDKDFFAGEKERTEEIRKLLKFLPNQACLILNFDDETVRKIKEESNLRKITFGFQEGADFQATDVKLNSGTNFKINYQGNIVPIWLEKLFDKEQIYSVLSAIVVGTILGLNLIEISQALKKISFSAKQKG